MTQYIKNFSGISIIDKTTNEKVLETEVYNNESKEINFRRDLIPMTMNVNDDFNMTVYITPETLEKLKNTKRIKLYKY